jgi:AcrR family transcriptional regulator
MTGMVSSSDGVQRRWRGREPADRVADRRAQLIEAGLELMGTAGARGVSMRGVCRQAGLTERYFYESFGHVDELLVEVLELVVLQARDALFAALGAAPAQRGPLIRHAVRAFTEFLVADARRGRVMFVESQVTAALAGRGAKLVTEFTVPIAGIFRSRAPSTGAAVPAGAADPTATEPTAAADPTAATDPVGQGVSETGPDDTDMDLNALAIFGALAFLYRRWLRPGERPVSEERFVEHVAQVIEQLAGAQSTPRPGRTPA